MTRARMSRPSASVPRRCERLGGARRASSAWRKGSASGSRSAKIARVTTSAIHSTAAQKTMPRPRRRRTGVSSSIGRLAAVSSAAMADTRVEHGVEQVDEEIDEDEADGDEQHAALEDDEVAQVDRFHEQSTDAGQCENRFRDHRPADEPPDIEAYHGNEGERGGLQGVH